MKEYAAAGRYYCSGKTTVINIREKQLKARLTYSVLYLWLIYRGTESQQVNFMGYDNLQRDV